jgi:hypothetical protein
MLDFSAKFRKKKLIGIKPGRERCLRPGSTRQGHQTASDVVT